MNQVSKVRQIHFFLMKILMKNLFDLFYIKFVMLIVVQIFVKRIENTGTVNAVITTVQETLGPTSCHEASLAWSIIARGDVKCGFNPSNLSQHHFFWKIICHALPRFFTF